MAKHKLDKKKLKDKRDVKAAMKSDDVKKATVSSLADRVIELEKYVGIR